MKNCNLLVAWLLYGVCVCVLCMCLCVSVEGGVALLIIERLYVNPKASVVVNLGEEAILNILLCSTQLSK